MFLSIDGVKVMVRRKFIPTRLLTAGMKSDQSIVDRMGRTLIARGAVMDQ